MSLAMARMEDEESAEGCWWRLRKPEQRKPE
jgi:hypothetical protein